MLVYIFDLLNQKPCTFTTFTDFWYYWSYFEAAMSICADA